MRGRAVRTGTLWRRPAALLLIAALVGLASAFPLPAGAAVDPSLEATLIHPAGSGADFFGSRVAIDGDTAVVAAPLDRSAGIGSHGSVQVFVRDGTGWTHQAELLNPGPAQGDEFGSGLAIDGDTVVVGAVGDDIPPGDDQGSAQVYVRNGTTWSHEASLVHPKPVFEGRFGTAVAIHGGRVLVGDPFESVQPHPDEDFISAAGTVHVFARGATTWSHQTVLKDANPEPADHFGSAIAMDATTIAIGTPDEDTGAGMNAGAIHVSGGPTLTHPGGAAHDRFGASVAVSGGTVIGGAPFHQTAAGGTAGSASIFDGGVHQATLVHPAGAAGDQFGNSVAIFGSLAVVGAPSDDTGVGSFGVDAGTAQVFRRIGGDWSPEAELRHPPDPGGFAGDQFGNSVALDGETAIAGAPFDNHSKGSDAGSAFIYRLARTPEPTTTTLASSANPTVVGAPVTYTATVDPSAAQGTVAFTEDGAAISGCSAQPLASGTAECTVSHGTSGDRTIVARYEGDPDFAASSSAPLTQSVVEAPRASLADASTPEDGAVVHVSVTLDKPAPIAARLGYDVIEGSAGPDDAALGTGDVDIPAGASSATIEVAITDDERVEEDESFTVRLTGGTAVIVGDGEATVTIVDDDLPPCNPVQVFLGLLGLPQECETPEAARVSATDAAGNRSAERRLAYRVVRR